MGGGGTGAEPSREGGVEWPSAGVVPDSHQRLSVGTVAALRPTRRNARGAAEGHRGPLPAGHGRESHPAEAGLADPGSAGGG